MTVVAKAIFLDIVLTNVRRRQSNGLHITSQKHIVLVSVEGTDKKIKKPQLTKVKKATENQSGDIEDEHFYIF